MAARLPTVGGDNGNWGTVLNDFLNQSHSSDGTLKSNSVGATQIQDSAISSAKLNSGVASALAANSSFTGAFAPVGGSSQQYPMRALTYKITQQQTGVAQVKWLTFGSSVADVKIRNIGSPYLVNAYGGNTTGSVIGSYGNPPAGSAVGVSTVTRNSTTGTVSDRASDFDVWPSGLTTGFNTTGSAVYGMGASSATCDHIEIYYITGPASSLDGGTFSYQVDSGSATNVDTSAGSAGIGRISLTPSLGSHTLTLSWISGNVRIVGVAFWRTDISGITWQGCAQGGINLWNCADQAFANFQTWLGWVQPDVITFEMKANQISQDASSADVSTFTKWVNAVRDGSTAGAGPDVIVIGSTPDVQGQAETTLQDAIRALVKTYQPSLNIFGWDGYRPLGSYTNMVAMGWQGDGIHPGWQAQQFLAFLMARDLNLFTLPFVAKSGNAVFGTAQVTTALNVGPKTSQITGVIKPDSSGTDIQINCNRWLRIWTSDGTTTEAMRLDPTGTISSWIPRATGFGSGNAVIYGADAGNLEARHATAGSTWANVKGRAFLALVAGVTHSSAGANLALDFSQRGQQKVTLNANVGTLSFTNDSSGCRIGVTFVQGSGGPYTVTSWTSSIKFSGGVAPTLSTTTGARDYFEFEYDAGNWYEKNRALDVR